MLDEECIQRARECTGPYRGDRSTREKRVARLLERADGMLLSTHRRWGTRDAGKKHGVVQKVSYGTGLHASALRSRMHRCTGSGAGGCTSPSHFPCLCSVWLQIVQRGSSLRTGMHVLDDIV